MELIALAAFIVVVLPIVAFFMIASLKGKFNKHQQDFEQKISDLQRQLTSLRQQLSQINNADPSVEDQPRISATASQEQYTTEIDQSGAESIADLDKAALAGSTLESSFQEVAPQDDTSAASTLQEQTTPEQTAKNLASATEQVAQMAKTVQLSKADTVEPAADEETVLGQEIDDNFDPWGSAPSSPSSTADDLPVTGLRKLNEKIGDYKKILWQKLKQINPFVSVGILVLFLGVSFLIKHAVENNMLPIEYRLAAIVIFSLMLLSWGWRLRDSKRHFALSLQGAAIALLYLTIYSSFALYQLLPSLAAFGLLALLVCFVALLSVKQNALALAVFAMAGGFLTPIITSSGSNNYIGLFSYYTLLNGGIFYLAWQKSWRILNLLGFFFTFTIASSWGMMRYQPEYYLGTQLFLIIFVVMYLLIGVMFAQHRRPFYRDYVDGSIVFGTPLIGFSLQSALTQDFAYGIAMSAVAFASCYLLIAQYLWSRYATKLALLCESFLIIGVIFLTLAVPYSVDGTLTGAIWAIEGVGILWLGIKQQQKNRRLFACALTALAPLALIYGFFIEGDSLLTGKALSAGGSLSGIYANSAFISTVLITLCLSFGSYLLQQNYPGKRKLERVIASAFLVYAVILLLTGFEYQILIYQQILQQAVPLAVLSFIGMLAYLGAGKIMNWLHAQWAAAFFVLFLPLSIILYLFEAPLVFELAPFVFWLVFVGSALWTLNVIDAPALGKPQWIVQGVISLVFAILLFEYAFWLLIFGYTLYSGICSFIGKKYQRTMLRYIGLSQLLMLLFASVFAVFVLDDLLLLASAGSVIAFPLDMAAGGILWPVAFIGYFYQLHFSRTVGRFDTKWLLYAGVALVLALCLYLALWLYLLCAVVSALLCHFLAPRLNWSALQVISVSLSPALIVLIAVQLSLGCYDLFWLQGMTLDNLADTEIGYLLWPFALSSLFFMLYRENEQGEVKHFMFYLFALLLPTFLITWEGSWHLLNVLNSSDGWYLAFIALPTLTLSALLRYLPIWPFNVQSERLQQYLATIMHTLLGVWLLVILLSSGSATPIFWLPIVNPLTITVVSAMLLFLLSGKSGFIIQMMGLMKTENLVKTVDLNKKLLFVAVYLFVYMNVEILRAVHHYSAVSWELDSLLKSDLSQTALSIYWTVTGLLGAVLSSRMKHRKLWLSCAGLLIIVVAKLFIIDMSANNTVERIVSFIAVGVLLMLIGYFSPLPPKVTTDSAESPLPQDDGGHVTSSEESSSKAT